MMGLHVEGHFVGVTKTHEGYMWGSRGNVTEKHASFTWNVTRSSNLNLIEYLSTPWHTAVDQDWRSKMCALKCASQPPDRSVLALLILTSHSGKMPLNPRYYTFVVGAY